MPRRPPADRALIAQVYEETGNKAETARRLGLHYNTVYIALRRREGLCSRCGVRPASETRALCEECRVYVNARETKKRTARASKGQCYICERPVDAPTSRLYCREHRLAEAARRRRNIAAGTRKPPDKHKIRMRNLRNTHGEGAVVAWQRDNGVCQSCGAVYEGRKMSIHHIDIDPTNNAAENLVVLCSPCHFLFHKVIQHPKAGAVIAWATMTYPDFAERLQHSPPQALIEPMPPSRQWPAQTG